jgi:hypothetical protein
MIDLLKKFDHNVILICPVTAASAFQKQVAAFHSHRRPIVSLIVSEEPKERATEEQSPLSPG